MSIPFCAEHPVREKDCGACTVVRWARKPGNYPKGHVVPVVGRCADCRCLVKDISTRCKSCFARKRWSEQRKLGQTGRLQ